MSENTLDVRGLLCPLPVIRTQDRVKDLHPGTRLEILCTDPGAVIDCVSLPYGRWIERA